ncbi:MAG: tyrosine--tRNA ligase [Phytoplasma sp.]|uniref:tyrosine--tRNA ligase n=1 Tax=Phytoplasma sp. TaxID=2155 RepID=UPI002B418002|nr:tyrosine--tRNA ligase [Phytoplasma sp.]WRH06676.1 MAG: tyrosine--tRNA ligase [Phytoplasma sp.]
MFLFQELKWRNLFKNSTDEKKLEKLLNQEQINFYWGFDLTADSLTIGHLVQIITILLLQKKGHKPFILIGRATSLIGDPKEKTERKLLSLEEIENNLFKIKKQLIKLLPENQITFVDNYDWISKIDLMTFLRDYGKCFNVNYMISKEKIAKRLDKGISYTEFSYMILQALDFYFLYKKHNVVLQLGGSDQWGNITSGLELIRKKETAESQQKPFALSISLLLDEKGLKIGKSEKNAIWLDEQLTNPYQIYQFFFNIDDNNVINYLKMLTLLEVEKILELEEQMKVNPGNRLAQRELAKQVVSFIHGEKIFQECFQVNNILFLKKIKEINDKEFLLLRKYLFSKEIKEPISLIDALVKTKLADSKKKAKTLITAGAIKIFQKTIKAIDFVVTAEKALCNNKYILLTKKNKMNSLIVFTN